MVKVNKNDLMLGLLLVTIAVMTSVVSFNVILLKTVSTPGATLTGLASSNSQIGIVNFTQAGAAGITLIDDAVEYGAGFYNSTCGSTVGIAYSILDSNDPYRTNTNTGAPAPTCWINITTFLGGAGEPTLDRHVIENNGTTLLNLSAISNKNAPDFVCGVGQTCSSENATVQILAAQNETSSCTLNLLTTYTTFTNSSLGIDGNRTVGLCDSLGFQDSQDTVRVFFNVSVPNDIPAGLKTMVVTYVGISI